MSYDCADWPSGLSSAITINCVLDATVSGSLPFDLFDSTKTSINLTSNGLSGTLDNLPLANNLASFSIRNNSISGALPAGMNNLTLLQTFDVSHNNLTGSIPLTFASLRALTSINLDGNAFTGCVPCPLGSSIVCSEAAAIQNDGSSLLFCATSSPHTSSPASGSPSQTGYGTETFSTSSEFLVVMTGLLGALIFMFAYCIMSAAFLRRKRFMREIINADQSAPVLQLAPNTALRDSSSAARQGALSFDGREGWRSDTELRISARGSRNSSANRAAS